MPSSPSRQPALGPARQFVVVGEALVDDYGDHGVVGGAPFNVARSLAAFGVPVLMITRIADDTHGALVRADFDRFGMTTAGLQIDDQHPTGRVIVEMKGSDHVFHILDNQAWDHLDAQAALRALSNTQPAGLYAGTLVQRAPASRAAVTALLGAVTAPHYVDLNLRDGQYETATIAATLDAADTVKVNEEELRHLVEWFVQPSQRDAAWDSAGLRGAIDQLMARFSLSRLVVTRGADGAACFDAGAPALAEPAGPPPPRWGDTVGAGDSFSAVYLLGQWRGWPLPQTLQRANAFAAAICGLNGAVPEDLSFYAPWRRAWGLA